MKGIKMETYEIMFSDLNPETQKDLLDFMGIDSEKDMNWDVFPIAEISKGK